MKVGRIVELPRVGDLDTLVRLLNERLRAIEQGLSRPQTLTADLDAGGYRIVNLGDPRALADAPNLAAVERRVMGAVVEAEALVAAVQTSGAAAGATETSVVISDVSNILLVSLGPVEADSAELSGAVLARIELSYAAPDPLGTPPADFQGVNAHIETPDGRIQPIGWHLYTGMGGGVGSVIITAPYPAQVEQWTVHLSARSEAHENKLELGTTPHIDIQMPADPLTGAAPDVEIFRAGKIVGGTFVAEMAWDILHQRRLVDWMAAAPATRINWTGLAIWIRTPRAGSGYRYVQATGVMDLMAFREESSGAYYRYDQIAIEATDMPPETWRFIAVSYNRKGLPNLSGGNPTGPYVDLQTLAAWWQLTDLTAAIGEYGYDGTTVPSQPVARVNIRYANAPDADEHTYYDFWTYITPSSVTEAPDAKHFGYAASMRWDSGRTDVDLWLPRPVQGTATQRLWIRAVTCNEFYSGPPTNASPATHVDITPPGVPAQVTGFSITLLHIASPVETFSLTANFTRPVDAEFWFARVQRIKCDPSFNPLAGEDWANVWEVGAYATPGVPTSQLVLPSHTYPPTTPEYWQFRAISVSRAGIENNDAPPTCTLGIPTVNAITDATIRITSGSDVILISPLYGFGISGGVYQANMDRYGLLVWETGPPMYRSSVTPWGVLHELSPPDHYAVIQGTPSGGQLEVAASGEVLAGVYAYGPSGPRIKVVGQYWVGDYVVINSGREGFLTSLYISGNLLINASGKFTPAVLDILGQLKIQGGGPGVNKVLTSDADGLATWETPSGGGGFVDRGDPEVVDRSTWAVAGAWTDWDLSAIVPAGAKAVLLLIGLQGTAVSDNIAFRRNGNVNNAVVAKLQCQVPNIVFFQDITVACDENRIIEYYKAGEGYPAIIATVKGWWF